MSYNVFVLQLSLVTVVVEAVTIIILLMSVAGFNNCICEEDVDFITQLTVFTSEENRVLLSLPLLLPPKAFGLFVAVAARISPPLFLRFN